MAWECHLCGRTGHVHCAICKRLVCPSCWDFTAKGEKVCSKCRKLLSQPQSPPFTNNIQPKTTKTGERSEWSNVGYTAIIILGIFLGIRFCGGSSEPKSTAESQQNVRSGSALQMMEDVFVGNYTKEQIKLLLDRALTLYGVSVTEENYSRAGSTLVALREKYGISEMRILDYMIRSHVKGVNLTFPQAAAWSCMALLTGDK